MFQNKVVCDKEGNLGTTREVWSVEIRAVKKLKNSLWSELGKKIKFLRNLSWFLRNFETLLKLSNVSELLTSFVSVVKSCDMTVICTCGTSMKTKPYAMSQEINDYLFFLFLLLFPSTSSSFSTSPSLIFIKNPKFFLKTTTINTTTIISLINLQHHQQQQLMILEGDRCNRKSEKTINSIENLNLQSNLSQIL